ncbi:MAG: hypothetical protein COT26_02880 [Candidatus Kerfeldbacteria bacterium CG08_land_8_20_14_0_20_43_14]|uniref:tetrahydrofolate synthase n=1 Tax=Candidatus Kerfeldbacteria bacterium CG08_land_8_20_14_0_20_43_14 TaxID=2014246 RepID=A0A2H0YS05_9BACT|nr:MAG: hypothetical protein COT26_02880 [Candidatus Kerfeldbacteria bacterium CG08_land_8_20_14_0_20_43_14]
MEYPAYKKAQKYLEALPAQVFATRREDPQLSLDRTRKMLKHFGSPEKNSKFIHITGTSGKGSLTMYLHNILHRAGKKVGSYFSPHVITTTERIMLNGKLTSVKDFLWAFKKIKPYLDHAKKFDKKFLPSHFESLFVMSLLIFQKHKLEWAVIEVGCGGEFDPTNVIPPPKIAIIANVGLDHQLLLGRTKIQIAKTKTGILKTGNVFFTGEANPKIRGILMDKARTSKIPAYFIPKIKTGFNLTNTVMSWQLPGFGKVQQSMFGQHQQHNATIAIAAARFLHLPKAAIKKGILLTRMPARIEFIQKKPKIIIDGAHNPDKIRAVVASLKALGYNQVTAVIGIGERKNAKAILKILKPIVKNWILTQTSLPYPKPMPVKIIAQNLKKLQPSAKPMIVSDCKKALARALKHNSNYPILITGSLYLAGELRQKWYPEKLILNKQSNF